jgi:hypothetical protein
VFKIRLESCMNRFPPEKSNSMVDDENTKSQIIPLIAGYRPDGEGIVEQLAVTPWVDSGHSNKPSATSNEYRLLRSPAFLRGLAAGDRIRFPAQNTAGYELIKRSGNLCIRVLRKTNIDEVLQALTPEIELMDGILDLDTPRVLVYSIHVSIGFQAIELLLDRIVGQFPDTVWYYGNVYDPTDGVTPLDWWQEFLAPV